MNNSILVILNSKVPHTKRSPLICEAAAEAMSKLPQEQQEEIVKAAKSIIGTVAGIGEASAIELLVCLGAVLPPVNPEG